MEIVQKKRSIKHTFTFTEDYFNFAYEEKDGSGDRDINYADVPQKSSIRIEHNDWLRNVGYLWFALGALQLSIAIFSDASLSGKGFWLMLGLICIIWAHLSKVKYTVFQTEHGNIFIMQDKNHDKIMSEINYRRKNQLLKWYGEINPDNDLENEIGKFKWLAEHDVITKDESEKKISQVKLLHKSNLNLSEDTVH